jgi:tRNA pseudouridine38-40 synthase
MKKMYLYVKVAYVGINYHGSQIQKNNKTVEGMLTEKARAIKLLNNNERIRFYSRTDKGVSSTGNIFIVNTDIKPEIFLRRINKVLKDIICYSYATSEKKEMVASKTYSYYMPKGEYDTYKLIESANFFVGNHDFTYFVKGHKPFQSAIDSIKVKEYKDHFNITFKAKKFEWGMIRKIVKTMQDYAHGTLTKNDILLALEGKKDIQASLAPGENLLLEDIDLGIKFHNISIQNEYIKECINNAKRDLFILQKIKNKTYI